jgi:hypothetical protein
MELSRESTFVFVGRWRVPPILIPWLLQPPKLPTNNFKLPILPTMSKPLTSSLNSPCATFAYSFEYHAFPTTPLIPLPHVLHVVDTGFDAPQAQMATGFNCTIFILASSRPCPRCSPRLPLRVRLSIGCIKTSGRHSRSFKTKKIDLRSLKTGGILPSSIRLPIGSLSLDWSRPSKAS